MRTHETHYPKSEINVSGTVEGGVMKEIDGKIDYVITVNLTTVLHIAKDHGLTEAEAISLILLHELTHLCTRGEEHICLF